jgi:hypothetical protein
MATSSAAEASRFFIEIIAPVFRSLRFLYPGKRHLLVSA